MSKNNFKFEILPLIDEPSKLKALSFKELNKLCAEIRSLIITSVARTGGHLSSNLGAVELTLALHYVFNSPDDFFIWDVGHQCYTHKILTGRFKQFATLRCYQGLSGFPSPQESPHDHFYVGHGSTAISQALGLAFALDAKREKRKIIAIIGDGSLAGGVAFEALNYAGHVNKDILIVLNDNEWAISKTVGGISRYLSRILINPLYNRAREELKTLISKLPLGEHALEVAHKLEEALKGMLVPGILFEELGIRYIGPLDGHNLKEMILTFKKVKELKGPVIVHVITKKGKGYPPAEKEPDIYHSSPPFNIETGRLKKKSHKTYTEIFAESLIDYALQDERIFAITAAMPHGTGLIKFKERFPERFIDVGMAEQNAVCLSSGLAKGGLKPVVAIYSTFIQRAYDQIFHDICLQNLPVVLCLDRAGIVGEDGPTHHGVYDLSFLRHLPNIVLMAPKDGWELRLMLGWALKQRFPIAIRYPKEEIPDLSRYGYQDIILGKAELLASGEGIAIIAYGSMVKIAVEASVMLLEKYNCKVSLLNLRFAKPLDEDAIINLAKKHRWLVILEESPLLGGIGEAIIALIKEKKLEVNIKRFALPDRFIAHGSREELMKELGIDAHSIVNVLISLKTEEYVKVKN